MFCECSVSVLNVLTSEEGVGHSNTGRDDDGD